MGAELFFMEKPVDPKMICISYCEQILSVLYNRDDFRDLAGISLDFNNIQDLKAIIKTAEICGNKDIVSELSLLVKYLEKGKEIILAIQC